MSHIHNNGPAPQWTSHSGQGSYGTVTGDFGGEVQLGQGAGNPHARFDINAAGKTYEADVNVESMENPDGSKGESNVEYAIKDQVVPSMPADGVANSDTESYVKDGLKESDFQQIGDDSLHQKLIQMAQGATKVQVAGQVYSDPPGAQGNNSGQTRYGVHDAHMNSGDPTRPTEPDGVFRTYTNQDGQIHQTSVYIKFQSQHFPGDTVNSEGELSDIRSEVHAFHAELTELRRDLHAHPELGMEETRTASLVAEKLRAWGVEVTEGVGRTGVVGTLRGLGSGSIGLRADMDALALEEQTGLPYKSEHPGRMHACGHDGHTTMLLGAARYLASHREFAGTVNFIFQPAEEGRGGATAMLTDGLFERFPCDAVYGMHSGPGLPAGVFATGAGPLMAASGRFEVTFRGAGGHGGHAPHLTPDLTVVQANYILALQTIVSREIPPQDKAVISVGYVAGGQPEALNVMPSELRVGGTVRCFNSDIQNLLTRRCEELAQAVAAMHKAKAEMQMWWTSPPLINPPAQVEIVARAARAVVGAEAVITAMPPVTGAEDFAYMLEARPGAFIFLGNGVAADGSFHSVHTPHYDFNDEVIPTGVAYWIQLVLQNL